MSPMRDEATFRVKAGLAEMLKGGVIMDVVDAALEHLGQAGLNPERRFVTHA